jgi:hypothetical protein
MEAFYEFVFLLASYTGFVMLFLEANDDGDGMKHEDRLFILGLMSLICSLFLFPFVAYLFPAVWLDWKYHMPEFVIDTVLLLQDTFQITYALALRWVLRLSFLSAIIFGVIAYVISHRISQLQQEENESIGTQAIMRKPSRIEKLKKQNNQESVLFFLKLVVIFMLVFIVSDMIQWAISFSSSTKPA